MTDREMVIQGLEYCASEGPCIECPYNIRCEDIAQYPCTMLARDALEVIRAQEPGGCEE